MRNAIESAFRPRSLSGEMDAKHGVIPITPDSPWWAMRPSPGMNGMRGLGDTFTPLVYTPVPVPALPVLNTATGVPIGMDLATAGNISLEIEKIQAGNRAGQEAVYKYNGEMNTYLLNLGTGRATTQPAMPDVPAIYQAAYDATHTGSFTSTPRVDVTGSGAQPKVTGGGSYTTGSAPVVGTPGGTVVLQNLSNPGAGPIVGDSLRVAITRSSPNSPVSVNASKDGSALGTSSQGTTDAGGNFSVTVTMSDADVGSWSEVWMVNGQAVGTLKFKVTKPTVQPGETPISNSAAGNTAGALASQANASAAASASISATAPDNTWLWLAAAGAAAYFFLKK